MYKLHVLLTTVLLIPLLLILLQEKDSFYLLKFIQPLLLTIAAVNILSFLIVLFLKTLKGHSCRLCLSLAVFILMLVFFNQLNILIVLLLTLAVIYKLSKEEDEKVALYMRYMTLLCFSCLTTLFGLLLISQTVGVQGVQYQNFYGIEEEVNLPVQKPDIYHFVLDAYAREDVLQQVYGFSDPVFHDFLEKKGFYIAAKSSSNYSLTPLSLASTLNYNYLQELYTADDLKKCSALSLFGLIDDNKIMRLLKKNGYRICSFYSNYGFADLNQSDKYLHKNYILYDFQKYYLGLLTRQSLLNKYFYDDHRDNILYTLNEVKQMAHSKETTFAFAHVLCPHPPFVFSNGEKAYPPYYYFIADSIGFLDKKVTQDDYIKGYTEQVASLNVLLMDTISYIFEKSKQPFIIILHADHGSRSILFTKDNRISFLQERMSIFNAIYTNCENMPFYESISPVNTYRLILKHIFMQNIELLPDKQFFSWWPNVFEFQDVTETLGSKDVVRIDLGVSHIPDNG